MKTLILTAIASLALAGDAFARIVQHGEAWAATLALRGKAVQCLAVDPGDSATVYAGTRGNGVWKSGDGGQSWKNVALPQPNVFSIAVRVANGAVYVGTEPSHLLVSRDGGERWRELAALRDLPSAPEWSFPPRPWTSHVRWIAPSPHDSGLLLVGMELGGLMRSRDGGESWKDHRPGAQKDVHALAWHPKAPGRAYEAGGGGAAWTHDGGEAWEAADAGRDRHYCWGLAVDPDDPDTWFAFPRRPARARPMTRNAVPRPSFIAGAAPARGWRSRAVCRNRWRASPPSSPPRRAGSSWLWATADLC